MKNRWTLTLSLLFAATPALAQIDRFYPIEPGAVYRGSAASTDEDYTTLKRLGIKTILDFRHVSYEDPKGDDLRRATQSGMRYVNVPIAFGVALKHEIDFAAGLAVIQNSDFESFMKELKQTAPPAEQIELPTVNGVKPDQWVSTALSQLGPRGLKSREDATQLLWALAFEYYPEQNSVNQALSVMRDTRNWPIYIHCQIGRDRTGLLSALFRTSGLELLQPRIPGFQHTQLSSEQAFSEMRSFGFDVNQGDPSGFTYTGYKDYLFDHAGK